MNSYTAKIDSFEFKFEPSMVSKKLALILGVDGGALCGYHYEVNLPNENEEWVAFWALFFCFLAEVDQETIDAIINDIEA